MSRTEHTQSVLKLLRKALVPGSHRLKAYWFIMKRRRGVKRHSAAEFYHWKRKKKKDDVLLLTSSLVCWEHNVKSCQPLLHLTETNPLKGLPLPAWRLYTLFTPGFPLTVRGYTRQVDWRLLVPEVYEWKCAIFNLFSTSTATKREC